MPSTLVLPVSRIQKYARQKRASYRKLANFQLARTDGGFLPAQILELKKLLKGPKLKKQIPELLKASPLLASTVHGPNDLVLLQVLSSSVLLQ